MGPRKTWGSIAVRVSLPRAFQSPSVFQLPSSAAALNTTPRHIRGHTIPVVDLIGPRTLYCHKTTKIKTSVWLVVSWWEREREELGGTGETRQQVACGRLSDTFHLFLFYPGFYQSDTFHRVVHLFLFYPGLYQSFSLISTLQWIVPE